jgi:type I restriction enzyme R subunit
MSNGISPDIENYPGKDELEKNTRERIDKEIALAGWRKNANWIDEYPVEGVPSPTGKGFVDYVFEGDDGRPLAVLEAKRSCASETVGREQALIYAEALKKKFHRIPVVFLFNGYEMRIIDFYGERTVDSIYSKQDLEKYFSLINRPDYDITQGIIDEKIVERPYQFRCIREVCKRFASGNRRALVVMATGSGKTRTALALSKLMMKYGWVKNVLYLADRNALVQQTRDAIIQHLPDVSYMELDSGKKDVSARMTVSTYPTMDNCINGMKDSGGNMMLTSGHFDLIIVDEAHRSIYNKYKAIFDHFDGFILGLTATPKDDVDRNTYQFFDMPGNPPLPTYAYELDQAIKDGWLVSYSVVDTKLKFLSRGINPEELDDDEREEFYRRLGKDYINFVTTNEMNERIFNYDTIARVLSEVMEKGLKVDAGSKIGKTIIFAKNHKHAEKILEVFNKEFPNYPNGFCKIIDIKIKYHLKLIKDFEQFNKMPQIAISVDMLDTGIDVPEILNLVFFKPVYSKTKFHQMIGRGTRKCRGLIDGKDKTGFLIFDYCGNFEFFKDHPKGLVIENTDSIQGKIFILKSKIAQILQSAEYQIPELIEFRQKIVSEDVDAVRALSRENYAVKQVMRFVDEFSKDDKWESLSEADMPVLEEKISPLITQSDSDIDAVRFDAMIHTAQKAALEGKKNMMVLNHIMLRVSQVAKHANIPAVREKLPFINKVLSDGYLENADLLKLEDVRKELRNLMCYIDKDVKGKYDTYFTDVILSSETYTPEMEATRFTTYQQRAERYLTENKENGCIQKLYHNEQLNDSDLKELEEIMYGKIGTKEEFEEAYPGKSLMQLVREINGLDRTIARQTLWNYVREFNLDDDQTYFLEQIVEHVAQNGYVRDPSIFMNKPFTSHGRISDLFGDDNNEITAILAAMKDFNSKCGMQ